MKIKRGPLVFHNVISAQITCGVKEWMQHAQEFRNAILTNGLYGTGPVFYQVSPIEGNEREAQFSFYLPVNQKVEMEVNDTFSFIEEWRMDDGLMLRHADLDEDLDDTYTILHTCAHNYELQLEEPFYHIYLDVYGEGIVDVFAPIVAEEGMGAGHDQSS